MTEIPKRHYGRRLPISETHPDSRRPMSDRDRIAAVVFDAHPATAYFSLAMAERIADALLAAGVTMPAPQSDYAKYFCRSGCDCSCCYGMDGCYHFADPCNCGMTAKEHRHV